jgi:acyl dehydratase
MTRLFVDHYLTKVASLGSPGGDELRWVKPVRPGDILSVRVTVLKAVPSKSKPDRGTVTSFVEVINQGRSSDDVQGGQHHRQALAGELKAAMSAFDPKRTLTEP